MHLIKITNEIGNIKQFQSVRMFLQKVATIELDGWQPDVISTATVSRKAQDNRFIQYLHVGRHQVHQLVSVMMEKLQRE